MKLCIQVIGNMKFPSNLRSLSSSCKHRCFVLTDDTGIYIYIINHSATHTYESITDSKGITMIRYGGKHAAQSNDLSLSEPYTRTFTLYTYSGESSVSNRFYRLFHTRHSSESLFAHNIILKLPTDT